jgi:hypothetical protein
MKQIVEYLASMWWTACGGLPNPNLVHRAPYIPIPNYGLRRAIRMGEPQKTRAREMVVSSTRVATSFTAQFVSGSTIDWFGRRLTWANSCNSPGRKTSTGTFCKQPTHGTLQTGVQAVRRLSSFAPTGLSSINFCCRSHGRAGQFHRFPECRKARQVPNTKETDVSAGRPSHCGD